MGLIWCGGEPNSFPNSSTSGLLETSTGGSYNRARCAINLEWKNPDFWYCKPFTPITAGWLSSRFGKRYVSALNQGIVGLGDSTSGSKPKGFYAGYSPDSDNDIALYSWDGATWTCLAKTTNNPIPAGEYQNHKYDIHLETYGLAGRIKLYYDLALVLDYSGDIRISGVTNFDCVALAGLPGWGGGGVYEVILHTDDTRLKMLNTHAVSGAGDSNAWTGAYTDIDDYNQNNADYIYTDADAQDALFALGNLSADEVVTDMKIEATITKTPGASVGTVKLGFKRSGGNIDVDAGHAATEGVVTYEERYLTSVDGQSLNKTLIDALQIVLRSAT